MLNWATNAGKQVQIRAIPASALLFPLSAGCNGRH
jgi:hypothetical protein